MSSSNHSSADAEDEEDYSMPANRTLPGAGSKREQFTSHFLRQQGSISISYHHCWDLELTQRFF